MKAVVCTKYGPPEVLQIKKWKNLFLDNEILIRILTVVVATEDPLVRKGKSYFGRVLFGFTKPKKPIQGAFVNKTTKYNQ
jgi:NADPH:quinone reductase-like Zn-dependent oxidoreductase